MEQYRYSHKNGWINEKEFLDSFDVRRTSDITSKELMYPNMYDMVAQDIKHRFYIMKLNNGKEALIQVLRFECSFAFLYKVSIPFSDFEIKEFSIFSLIKIKNIKTNKWGLYDLITNKWLFQPEYDDLEYVGSLRGHYQIENKPFYDSNHNILIIKVTNDNKQGIIRVYTDPDANYKETWVPIKYDEIKTWELYKKVRIGEEDVSFSHFLFTVKEKKDNKYLTGAYLFIDKYRDYNFDKKCTFKYYKRYIIPEEFDDLFLTNLTNKKTHRLYINDPVTITDDELHSNMEKGLFKFKLNNKWGLYNGITREIVIPPLFDNINDFYCVNDLNSYLNASSLILPFLIYTENQTYIVDENGINLADQNKKLVIEKKIRERIYIK